VTYGSLIHGADRQMVWNRIQKALRDQKSFNLSYRLISADRRELWVWEQGQGIFDADGNVIALEGFISDVTKTKHMEIALTESDERFNLAMEASRDGIFDWNLVTNAIYYSPGWKKMLGYPYHELPNDFSVWEKLTSPEDVKRSWKMQKELVNGERNRFEIEFKMKHKDGHWVDILSRANAYFDEKGKPVRIVGTHVDISQRKRMEEALHHALKMESIGTLAGGIAHDFNNILGIILGNTELALEDVPEWNPGRQNLAEVKTACLRAKGVVQQILSFSHKSEIHHEQFNPALVVEDSLKLIRSSLPTSIDIQKNISGNIHDMIGDSTQLHQIVINLCTNAAHAMEINGGLLDVSLENIIVDADTIGRHSELTSGPHVRLRVRDTGEGIPADAVDRVFDPYFTTKEVGKGTGLGLSVVHGIVTRHQGEISVESALGRGTTFEILFPAVLKRAPAKFSKPKELSTGSEHILLVDDEASLLNLIRQRLERLGYVVTGMTDAQAALALFESNPDRFDLIVTDMTMPQMTGDLLAQKILNVKPHMPIVLCTGYSEKMNRETARKLGIRKYIEKPIETAHLANVVREALDNPDSGA
jgi:PAS domain S-box-containing protein